MKFYTVALFLFIFNLLVGFSNFNNTFSARVKVQTLSVDTGDGPERWDVRNQDTDYLGSSVVGVEPSINFGDFITSLRIFTRALVGATIAPGWYIGTFFSSNNQAGVNSVGWLINGMVWMIYLIGGVQFISNRGFKSIS